MFCRRTHLRLLVWNHITVFVTQEMYLLSYSNTSSSSFDLLTYSAWYRFEGRRILLCGNLSTYTYETHYYGQLRYGTTRPQCCQIHHPPSIYYLSNVRMCVRTIISIKHIWKQYRKCHFKLFSLCHTTSIHMAVSTLLWNLSTIMTIRMSHRTLWTTSVRDYSAPVMPDPPAEFPV